MSNSHLGQLINNHVTLVANGHFRDDFSVTWTFHRIYQDGTTVEKFMNQRILMNLTQVDVVNFWIFYIEE